MYVLQPFALPIIYLFKFLAAVCLFASNTIFSLHSVLLKWSMSINDVVEAEVWPKE